LWAGFLVYHFFGIGTGLPVSFWIAMVILTVLILSADFLMNAYFVKKYGGSKLAMTGAVAGLILGTILLGPVGILVGPFVLAFVIAYLKRNQSRGRFVCQLFDKVVNGDSIYISKIQKEVTEFCSSNLNALKEKKVGLFI
jgi:hypothetical protein